MVAKKYSRENFVEEIKKPRPKGRGISDRIIHRLGLNTLSLNASFPFNLDRSFIKGFDIVHLHDAMGGYFNLAGPAWLSKIKPVVWTLHTMWPFTGACLYSYDCERWKRNCGRCPQFGKFPLNYLHRDGSFLALNIKRLIYGCSRLFPVAPSKWVGDLAGESILGRFDIETIENRVDTDVFYPLDKKEAKAKLKIPPEARTIIFSVASNPEDKRKGTDIILKALPLLKTKGIFLIPLTITPGDKNSERILKGYPSLRVTHIEDEHRLNLIYNAADVLWHPSLADNAPLTILEAFASGTPTIVSKVGGVQEMVIDGEDGFFVEPGNPEQLARKTDVLFSDDKRRLDMSKNARQRATSCYSPELFLDRYESLYRKALKEEG